MTPCAVLRILSHRHRSEQNKPGRRDSTESTHIDGEAETVVERVRLDGRDKSGAVGWDSVGGKEEGWAVRWRKSRRRTPIPTATARAGQHPTHNTSHMDPAKGGRERLCANKGPTPGELGCARGGVKPARREPRQSDSGERDVWGTATGLWQLSDTVLSIDDMMTKGSWTSCALPGLGATLELDADLASPGRRKADFCVSGGTKELSTLEANEPAGRARGGRRRRRWRQGPDADQSRTIRPTPSRTKQRKKNGFKIPLV
ncbi:hypothetical protein C8J57DRAFT_1482316 [Mycena rebaudengoi]|nr:hypothetical protein C8J57DRAFT_1482316 [Mycena rebaudengoi]